MFRLELYDTLVREREQEIARQSRWNAWLREMRADSVAKSRPPLKASPDNVTAPPLREASEASR